MKLPGFLIVGAMKSGTTTLYRDLQSNPRIFMPDDKEPESLIHDAVRGEEGRAAYASLFRRARDNQLCGEASTAYTKRPTYGEVPDRARSVLGATLKIIYVVREPVARAISHHRHLAGIKQLPADFDAAVRRDNTLIDYGRYAMQIEPWIEAFGCEQVRVICFEQYVEARPATVDGLCRFLGVRDQPHQVDSQRVYNKSEGKPQMVGVWRGLRGNFLYDRIVRPLLPPPVRERLRRALLPREQAPPAPPSSEMLDRMVETFGDDTERLRGLLGLEAPFWNFEDVRAAYGGTGRSADGG